MLLDRDEGPLERDRDPVRWDFCDRWVLWNDIVKERGNERGSVLPLQTVCLNSARSPPATKWSSSPLVRSTTWGRLMHHLQFDMWPVVQQHIPASITWDRLMHYTTIDM